MCYGRVPFCDDSLDTLRDGMRALDFEALPVPAHPQRSVDVVALIRSLMVIDPGARPTIDDIVALPELRRHDVLRRLDAFAPFEHHSASASVSLSSSSSSSSSSSGSRIELHSVASRVTRPWRPWRPEVRATVEKIQHASSLMLTHSYSNSNLEMAGRMAQSDAGASAAGDSIESFPLVVRSPQLGPPPSLLHGDSAGVVRRRVSSPIPADRGSRRSSGDSTVAAHGGLVVPLLRLDESSVRSAPLAPSVSLSPRPPPPRIVEPVGSQGTSSKSVDQRANFVRA
jgi:hypothetical protein